LRLQKLRSNRRGHAELDLQLLAFARRFLKLRSVTVADEPVAQKLFFSPSAAFCFAVLAVSSGLGHSLSIGW